MANDLAVLESELTVRATHFEEILGATGVDPARFKRCILQACEANPALLECKRDSIMSAAMSAAVLGLEIDGVTGQAFMIPFAKRAQLVVGYKGFNTLAARAGITITAGVVRAGDDFDFNLGSDPWVKHKPKLGKESERDILAAWAVALHKERPPVPVVLSIDALMATKERSPGAKRSDSPWQDPAIGFPAMCEKTARRRLARSLPQGSFQKAARMAEAFEEQGLPGTITEKGDLLIDGTVEDTGPPADLGIKYQYKIEKVDGGVKETSDGDAWKAHWLMRIASTKRLADLQMQIDRNRPHFADARKNGDAEIVSDVMAAYEERRRQLGD